MTNNLDLKYNFSLDQNYNDFNYNEIGTKYENGLLNLSFDYLSENKHIGNQDYFKTEINLKKQR